jgi:DNA-binding IclR family transcriptional regulator
VAVAPGRHAIRHASWLGQQVSRRSTALGAALAGRVDADGAVVRVDAVESGVTAVAAPVRGASGAVVASISVVGPTFRLDGAALHTARRAVAERAGSLTSELTAELGPR